MTEREQVGGDHYQGKVQPIDLIKSQGMDFCSGSAVKYLVRYKRKGTPRLDLLKAKQYIDFLLEEYPEETSVPRGADQTWESA